MAPGNPPESADIPPAASAVVRSASAHVPATDGQNDRDAWYARCGSSDVMNGTPFRVLVTWGSKRGGTEGIARTVGDTLRAEGLQVDVLPPREAAKTTGFHAGIVGGALYAGRLHHAARRFVARRQRDLRRVPVWFFR